MIHHGFVLNTHHYSSKARRAGVELLRHARAFCHLFFIAFLAGAQSFWQKETLEEYFKEDHF